MSQRGRRLQSQRRGPVRLYGLRSGQSPDHSVRTGRRRVPFRSLRAVGQTGQECQHKSAVSNLVEADDRRHVRRGRLRAGGRYSPITARAHEDAHCRCTHQHASARGDCPGFDQLHRAQAACEEVPRAPRGRASARLHGTGGALEEQEVDLQGPAGRPPTRTSPSSSTSPDSAPRHAEGTACR